MYPLIRTHSVQGEWTLRKINSKFPGASYLSRKLFSPRTAAVSWNLTGIMNFWGIHPGEDPLAGLETPRPKMSANFVPVGLNRDTPLRSMSSFILVLWKLRMPQIRGVKGEAVVNLCRILDNAGDAVSSAFPKGKQRAEKSIEQPYHREWFST